MRQRRTVTVRTSEQLRAIASPLAHRVVAAMEHLGRATVAEVAELIRVPAGSLYYHVRRMKHVGLLREVDRQETGRRSRAVYELAGKEVVIDVKRASRDQLEELNRSRRIMLRFAERSLEAGTRELRGSRGARRVKLIQRHVRLGRRDLAALDRRLEELATWVAERDDPDATFGCVVTLALGPTPESVPNTDT